MLTRRRFLAATGAGLLAVPSFLEAAPDTGTFYVGVIADTHIIDDYYQGPEGSPEDTESIFKTEERLLAAREVLDTLTPALDLVFLVGDYFHDYPSADLDFYYRNSTRIDRAKALTDAFRAPVHVGFGNHDYAVPAVSREATHELFRRKLGVAPYYSVDHKGWRFIHVNNFLGATWQPGHSRFAKREGSLGEEQLAWLDAQLAEGKPSFVFVHYPLRSIAAVEVADLGLHTLLRRHSAVVQRVISGHWHRWVDVGREYGPPHLVIASTRYDPDAYLIVEVNAARGTHRLLNLHLVEWNTHFSQRYSPVSPG